MPPDPNREQGTSRRPHESHGTASFPAPARACPAPRSVSHSGRSASVPRCMYTSSHCATPRWHDCEMHDDTIELRQPADETDALKAYLKPIGIAFGDTYDDAEFEADRPVWEIDRTIGAVEGDTWVGGGGAYSFRLTVPGRREVRAAGITGVGVSPTHRRRGILTKMMRWLLDQAAERGEPVSVLHASEGAIYPRFGFGLGTLQGS